MEINSIVELPKIIMLLCKYHISRKFVPITNNDNIYVFKVALRWSVGMNLVDDLYCSQYNLYLEFFLLY